VPAALRLCHHKYRSSPNSNGGKYQPGNRPLSRSDQETPRGNPPTREFAFRSVDRSATTSRISIQCIPASYAIKAIKPTSLEFPRHCFTSPSGPGIVEENSINMVRRTHVKSPCTKILMASPPVCYLPCSFDRREEAMEERSSLRECDGIALWDVELTYSPGILRSTEEGSRWIVEPLVLGSGNSGSCRGMYCLRTSRYRSSDRPLDRLTGRAESTN
jgi:hypothetical protein